MLADEKTKTESRQFSELQNLAQGPLALTLALIEAAIKTEPTAAIPHLDRNGVIYHWNNACEQLYGYTASEAVGQPFEQILSTDEHTDKLKHTLKVILDVERTIELKHRIANIQIGKEQLRKTGIKLIPNLPWGSHICQFYHTQEDLNDILVPYFKAGLENNEFCMWVTSEPLNLEDAKIALAKEVGNLTEYFEKGQIEIIDYNNWYTRSGYFDPDKVLQGWGEKEKTALEKGFDGLRLTGNTFWLEKKGWRDFADYEAVVNSVIGKYKMLAICTYCLDKCTASEIIDVVSNHQFTLLKQNDRWQTIENSEHKQRTQSLLNNEKKYQTLINTIPIGIQEIDKSGRITFANKTLNKIYGYDDGELLGKKIFNLAPSEHERAKLQQHFDAMHNEQLLPIPYETELLTKNDRIITVQVNWNYKHNNSGHLVGFTATVTDLTEQKFTERTLKESKYNFKSIFDNATDGILLANPETRKLHLANNAICHVLGYSSEEIKSLSITDIHPEKDLPYVWEQFDKSAKEKYGIAHNIPMKRKDGTIFYVDINTFSVKLAGKEYLAGIFRDITEHLKTEENLQKSRERFRAIADYTYALESWHGTDGKLLWVNPAVQRLTGYTADQCMAMPDYPLPLIHEDDREDIAKVLQQAIEEKTSGNDMTFRLQHKNGPVLWVTMSWQPIYNTLNVYIGIRSSIRDITEHMLAEEALQHSEARYRSLINDVLDSSSVGIFILNSDFKVVWVNRALERFFGLRREKIIGKDKRQLIHTQIKNIFEDPQTYADKVIATYDNNTYIESFECHVLPNGWRRERWLEHRSIPIKSGLYAGGRIEHYYDITNRKKAEEALRSERTKMINILDSMEDGVYIVNKNYDIEYINPVLRKQFGSPDRQKCYSYFHDRTEVCPWCKNQDVWAGKSARWEWYSPKNRKTYDLLDTPLKNADGTISKLEIFRDITERKKAEEQIENLAKFPSENPCPVLRIAKDGTILYANSAAAPLLKQWNRHISQTIPQNWCNLITETLYLNRNNIKEVHCNGNILSFAITPVIDGDYVNLYGRDITEHRKVEQQILTLNKELEQRVAERTARLTRTHQHLLNEIKNRVSLEKEILEISEREKRLIGQELHDSVGQQFAGIALMIKALEQKLAAKQLNEANKAAQIGELVNQAMDQARGLAKGLHPVDLDNSSFTLSLQELAATTKNLFSVNCSFQCDKPIPIADTQTAVHLYRIAQEAINNAIKHGNAKNIQIALTCGTNTSVLTIENDGVDFPEHELQNTGMGLHIMNHRAEMVHGSLNIKNAEENGTVVTCVFPNKKFKPTTM